MTTDRIPCSVPFCRRTIKAGKFDEWVCGKHWRLVPPALKARKRRMLRLFRKAHARKHPTAFSFCTRANDAWAACKVAAIEAAAGI